MLYKAKHSKKIKYKIKKIIIFVLCIFIICNIFYMIRQMYITKEIKSNYRGLLESININENEISNTVTERMLKIRKLAQYNSDVIGWIEINDTNISYPVLHTDNNEYYLNHNYKKEISESGSIFLDKNYNEVIPSSNILIYGHRNKTGLMFEDLIKYKDKDFFEKHKYIKYTTSKDDSIYEIFSVFNSRVFYKNEKNVFRYYYFVNASNENEFYDYVRQAKEASIYKDNVEVSYGEQLLTLSTCDYNEKNGRFVIVAKKVK